MFIFLNDYYQWMYTKTIKTKSDNISIAKINDRLQQIIYFKKY